MATATIDYEALANKARAMSAGTITLDTQGSLERAFGAPPLDQEPPAAPKSIDYAALAEQARQASRPGLLDVLRLGGRYTTPQEAQERLDRAGEGLKTLGESFVNTVKNAASFLLPQHLLPAAAQSVNKMSEMAGFKPVPGMGDQDIVSAFGQHLKDYYGSWDKAKAAINTDPFGVVFDASLALEGAGLIARGAGLGAAAAGAPRAASAFARAGEAATETGRVVNPVAQTASIVTRPLRAVVGNAIKLGTPVEMPEAAATRTAGELEQRMMTTKWGDVGDVVTAAGEGHAGASQVLEQMRTADTPAQVEQASLRLQDFRTEQRASSLYQNVQEIAQQEGAGNVPPGRTAPLAEGLSNRLRQAFVSDRPTLAVVRGIEDKLQPKLIKPATKTSPAVYGPPDTPFLTMNEASSDLGRIIREGRVGENAVIGEKGIGQLQTLKDAIDADIQAWGQRRPRLMQALEDANTYYREQRAPFKERNVAGAATTDEPSQILKKFVQEGNPERAQKFYEALDPKGRAAVQTGLIQNAVNAASDPVQPFSSEKFIAALEGQKAATGVFFQGTDAQMLDGLRNLVIDTAKKDIQVGNVLPSRSIRGVSLRWLTDSDVGRQLLYRMGSSRPGSAVFDDLFSRAKSYFKQTPHPDEPPPVPRPPGGTPPAGSPGEPPPPAPAAPANLRDLTQPITDPSRLLPAPPRVFYMGPGKDTSFVRGVRGQYPEVTPPLFRNLEDIIQPAPVTPPPAAVQRTLADVVQPGQTFEEANAERLREFGASIAPPEPPAPAAAPKPKGKRAKATTPAAEVALRPAAEQAAAPPARGANGGPTPEEIAAREAERTAQEAADAKHADFVRRQEAAAVERANAPSQPASQPTAADIAKRPAAVQAKAPTIEPDARRDTRAEGQAVQRPVPAGAGVAEQPRAPRRAAPPAAGEAVSVRVPGETTRYPARYGLRELDDLYPSHSGITFQPSPDYPFKNTRNYADKSNQERVVVNSMAPLYDPAYIVTDAPDATNGPPIIDADGNVLGGNQRAMIMQRVYSTYKKGAEDFRDVLARRAHVFGLKAEDVRAMKRPMLVRELDADVNPQRAIADLNKKGTADYTASERAAADAGMLSPEAAEYIAGVLESAGSDTTLYEVLDSARGPEIVNKLVQDGVFTLSEKNAILDEGTKKVTAAGKERISKMLLGALFDDSEQIKRTAPALRNKLERVVSPILQTSQKAGFDLVPATKDAIRLLEYADAHGIKNLDDLLGQETLFGGGQTAGDLFPPEVVMLAKYLREHSPLDIVRAYRRFIANSEPTMFGESTRAEALGDAFQSAKPLSQADELKLRRLPPQK